MHFYIPLRGLTASLLFFISLAHSAPQTPPGNARSNGIFPLLERSDNPGTSAQTDGILVHNFSVGPEPSGDPVASSGLHKRATSQQIALASYISPGSDPAAWNRLISYPKQKISILVANILNGPNTHVDTAWKNVIDQASASGKTVLGYVPTGYLGLSSQQFKTRLGWSEIADWTAQIERDVDIWYELYGTSIKGIFFDEGIWDCGPSNAYSDIYKHINQYTKRKHPGAVTVLNPGSPVGQCYENTMDTLVTFEGSYQTYTSSSYQGLTWVPQDPRKIWHIIYDTPASAIPNAAQLSRDRGVGLIHLTDDRGENPYDVLPSDAYMQAQMAAVDGGTPLNTPATTWPAGPAASTPPTLAVPKFDYSSARLTWGPVTNALGYNIYLQQFQSQPNFLIASTPPTIRNLTIGGLPPGTTLTFYIRAIGGGGAFSPDSNSQTVTLTSLPSGQAITSPSAAPSSSSTVYRASVLVPYGFLRLFIWDSVSTTNSTNPYPCYPPTGGGGGGSVNLGWPILYTSTPQNKFVCTKYLVEGSTLFKYTGTAAADSQPTAPPPWSWVPVGTVAIQPAVVTSADPYRWTWTVPLGTSTSTGLDPGKFIVQGDGLGPFINVFASTPVFL